MKCRQPLSATALSTICALTFALACSASAASDAAFSGDLPQGTWGGDSGGLIVEDTAIHLHIGCTYGDISGKLTADPDGNFSVSGRYLLRAYPVAIGPTMPALFTGRVTDKSVTITVTVNDTVARQAVVRGPVTLTRGVEPRTGPCPICRNPFTDASRRAP